MVSLAAALLLAACASPGPPQAPRPVLDAQPLAAGPAGGAPVDWPAAGWWRRWNDPALTSLIERALTQQPTLQQAAARVAQAAARADAAAADGQPQAQLSADATRQHFSARGLVPPALAGATRWSATVQAGASWELDLFGRRRAALDAAIGRLRAAEADAQAAQVWLAAQLATRWFALARLLEADRLADEGQRRREAVLALQQAREAAGLDGAAARVAAEGALAQGRADRQTLAEAIARERHALAELAALPPQALDQAAPRLAALQPRPLPRVLGADLLGRRADLVAERWRVESAQHEQAVAQAQFYPDLNLVGFAGLSSLGLDHLVNAAARTFGVGPALRLPLFEGGRLRAQAALRAAEADTAIEGWNAALLRALREAADEIATLQALQRQRMAQAESAAAAEAAHALAQQRHAVGLAGRLPVLEAEAAVLQQRRAAVDLQARQLDAEVALIRALGGGYEAAPALAQAAREASP
ncbi:MAG: efflux transporter outer membrane subunit [Rubrivivax sp.]